MQIDRCTLTSLARLARIAAAMLKAGDAVILRGEIGAGKTAFAKRLIGALLADAAAEIPSPAFAIQQTYDTPRLRVVHADFYRLNTPSEVDELGFADADGTDVLIAEWPERGVLSGFEHGLELTLSETFNADERAIALTGYGRWERLHHRLGKIYQFLSGSDWDDAEIEPLTGDASARVYYRLRHNEGHTALLMDWPRQPDGPPVRDGKPYSQIAHLAEDVTPFVAVASALHSTGLKVPQIYQQDLAAGLLLIEDFGDDVFQSLARDKADMRPLLKLAVDALLQVRQHTPPVSIPIDGGAYALSSYDRDALSIEVELLPDWYIPFVTNAPAGHVQRQDFCALWAEQIDWLIEDAAERRWVLRDFHSPNLLRLGGVDTYGLGVIDFQDALTGHSAYDLVSLLQDARIDLLAGSEGTLLGYYARIAGSTDSSFDAEAFNRAYAVLGAQRSTKILGIFARLALRDKKTVYLQHMPRVAGYLRKNLDHPALLSLRAWYRETIPALFPD